MLRTVASVLIPGLVFVQVAAAQVVLRPGDIIVSDTDTAGTLGGLIRVDPVTGEQTSLSSGGLFRGPSGVALSGGMLFATDSTASPDFMAAVVRVDPASGAQTY